MPKGNCVVHSLHFCLGYAILSTIVVVNTHPPSTKMNARSRLRDREMFAPSVVVKKKKCGDEYFGYDGVEIIVGDVLE